jgi:tetratricopeptide (TPR) repeat protein
MGHPKLDDIRAELAASGRGLVVVGSGVAQAATADSAIASLASWDGLLRHGLDHCVRFTRKDDDWAARLRTRLDPPAAAGALLDVAGEICAALAAPGLGELGRWLAETVGSFRAVHRDELEALRDLGLPLATTNYDDLLEEVTGLPAATWQDTWVIEDLVRGKSPRAILHLHGHWQRPDSVVLDSPTYARAAPIVQALLRALRLGHTLLFVGCGEGLADPSWSTLRSWSQEILAGSRYRHFRLCRTGELADLERQHPLDERLFPVAYGPSFGDLAPFLSQLRAATTPAPTPLPVASRCFGRDEEVAALVAALCALPPRPAAVLGPPGVGKTTLTLVALNHPRVVARFGGRRYFARCAAATSRGTLLNAIALALGLDLSQAGPRADPEARIVAYLAPAPSLLILDNAETPWEADLGGGTAGLEELLVSLTALPEFALALSLRGAERPVAIAWRETIALDPLAAAPAREVFLDIAGDAHRDDPLLDPLLAAVGGLPLALVLLAAQAEGTPLSNVWQRWRRERSRLLQRGCGDTRETSFEASIALSLDSPRMTPAASRLATLLALLPDGMADDDLEALEPHEGADASARLRKLGLALPRDARLRLYSPIREELARTQTLTAAEHERLRAHYLGIAALGERAGREGGLAALERLVPELGNLEAILAPVLAGPAPEPAIAATCSLVKLARLTGLPPSALFEQALAAAKRLGVPETIAQCLFYLGDFDLARARHNAARSRYEEALPLFRHLGNLTGEASCIKHLGDIALQRSDYDAACTRYEEALPLFRRDGNLLGEAYCIQSLGDIALERSDHDVARTHYEEALQLFRRVGDFLGEANCIRCLGVIGFRHSEHDVARARYEEALQLYRRVGSLLGEANCIQCLADIHLERSDFDSARARYEEALPLFRRVGDILGEANCSQGVGDIALGLGDEETAGSAFAEALALYARIPEPNSIGCAHRRLARVASRDAARRAHHLAAARAAWRSIQRPDLIADLDREFPPDSA